LPGYALSALDPDETELVARHISTCVACREELADYALTTGALAFAVPPRQVPLRARAGLLARLDEVGTTNEERMIVLRPEPEVASRNARPLWNWLPRPKLALPDWPRSRVAAFAAVPMLLVAALVIAMGDRINDQQNEIEQIKAEQAETDRTMMSVEDAGTVQDVISSSAARDAAGKIIINRETDTALLLVVGLPQPAEDEHYIVWLEFAANDEYAKIGPLTVEPDGRARMIVDPTGPMNVYDGVRITAESDPETTSPTGPELMMAGIATGN
jgi:desulfoferrodoxin (superoxide reductase-like protein)